MYLVAKHPALAKVKKAKWMRWQEALLKWGKIAYETGQRLEFSIIKRINKRHWRIELKKLEEHGEDDFFEED